MNQNFPSAPCRLKVIQPLASRYQELSNNNTRPLSWDERFAGEEMVLCSYLNDDRQFQVKLYSDPQQSTPQPGWIIFLIAGDQENGFYWTLYGLTIADTNQSAALFNV
ncbi:MAG TPA: hypothetical protein PKD37_00890 [Oligoflexia bacterium]|nr:hypothetical protein [Oligoflexia bacterium]HMP26536.1 hypothetical protein [Oligoflexia bacterium]